MQENYKSGFIALVGRPNVGKSSLLNEILEQKIAIVSSKVQTTRNKILGVYNYSASQQQFGQIVFLDLPGLHKPVDKLGENCLKISFDGAKEADIIIFISESNSSPGAGDNWIIDWLKTNCPEKPCLLVLNKKDLARNTGRLKENIELYKSTFNGLNNLNANPILISVAKKNGLDELLDIIYEHLPFGPQYFPDDIPTNRSLRSLATELIREQVLIHTAEEVPHCTAVEMIEFDEKSRTDLITIRAFILVETESQKGILIGKKGQKIQKIGSEARIEIEKLLSQKVFLDLKVKVSKKWRQNDKELSKLAHNSD